MDGGYSERGYDPGGRLVTLVDRGTLRTYEYDDAGRQTKDKDALGNERVFTYDDAGRRTKVRDQRGFETTFDYDDLGRLLTTHLPDTQSTGTTYDLLGRRTVERDQAGDRKSVV